MSQQEASGPHSPALGVNLGVRTAGKEVGCSESPCLWGPCASTDSLRGGEDGRSVMSWASPGTPPLGFTAAKAVGAHSQQGRGPQGG